MIEVFEQATKLIEEHGYSIHDYLYAVEAYGSSILGLSAKAQAAFNCYYDLLIAGVNFVFEEIVALAQTKLTF